jgi:hypothetical protein
MKYKTGDIVRLRKESELSVPEQMRYSWHKANPEINYIGIVRMSDYWMGESLIRIEILYPVIGTNSLPTRHWTYNVSDIEEVIRLKDLPKDIRQEIIIRLI